MDIVIIQNKHISHVLVTQDDSILLKTDVSNADVSTLLEHSFEGGASGAVKAMLDAISYSKPYKVYVCNVETKKAPVVKKAPAKKAK